MITGDEALEVRISPVTMKRIVERWLNANLAPDVARVACRGVTVEPHNDGNVFVASIEPAPSEEQPSEKTR